jgi:hypothetical protein
MSNGFKNVVFLYLSVLMNSVGGKKEDTCLIKIASLYIPKNRMMGSLLPEFCEKL